MWYDGAMKLIPSEAILPREPDDHWSARLGEVVAVDEEELRVAQARARMCDYDVSRVCGHEERWFGRLVRRGRRDGRLVMRAVHLREVASAVGVYPCDITAPAQEGGA